MYDWNNSYSSMNTPLSQKLTSEYDSSILKSGTSQRGKTLIKKILVDNKPVEWRRISNHQDMIEIELNKDVLANDIVKVQFEYELFIPIQVVGYGYKNNTINLKNCFLRFSQYQDNEWLIFSNLGLNDQFLPNANVKIKISHDSNYFLISNLKKESIESSQNVNTVNLEGNSISDIYLIFTNQSEFENIKINQYQVLSNSKKILSLSSKNIENIANFFNDYFKEIHIDKIVLNDYDFRTNSLYPYSEIPEFLDPFKKNQLNEINLAKNLIKIILKNSLNINTRELYWLSSGMELYYLNKFIVEYHQELPLIGKFSNLFFIKKHNVSLMKFSDQFQIGYKFVSGRNLNQKISLPSDELTRINYRLANPAKSFYSMRIIENYLGSLHFKKSIKEIFDKKDPITNNNQVQKIFEANSTKNLKWFFSNYLNYDGLIDFKINKKDGTLKLKNSLSKKSQFKIPVLFESVDGKSEIKWLKKDEDLSYINKNETTKLVVDPNRLFFDENYKNNSFSFNDKFNTKIKFRFFSDLDNLYYNQVFYRPQFLYNLYDGFSPGVTLTNKSPFRKKFTYLFSPFYSFKTQKIIGNLNLNYRKYHSKIFSSNYYLSLSKFHYDKDLSYQRLSPTLLFTLRDKNLVSNYKQFLRLKYIGLNKFNKYNDESYGVSKLTYINSNPGAKKSYSFTYDLQFNKEILKNSITINYRNYFSEFRQYNFRLFVGKFFKNRNIDGTYDFSVDQAADYLYDNYLLGRSESSGFFSQQYVRYEGSFKSKISEFRPNDFMISINSGVTLWRWIEAYLDYGLFKNKNQPTSSGFDSGLRLNIVENYFELFFPIYSSKTYYSEDKQYSERIRFIFTLDPENLSRLFTRRWF